MASIIKKTAIIISSFVLIGMFTDEKSQIENQHMELLVHRVKGKETTNFYILIGYHPHMVHNVLELKDKVKILRTQLEKLIQMM